MNNIEYELESHCYNPPKQIRNYAFMAYQLALSSPIKKGRHCAILLDHDSNILEIFVNKWHKYKGITVHAEYGAINKYIENNSIQPGCWLLVIRGNMLGDIKLSRPCLDCYNTIKNNNLSKVVWSTGYMKFEVSYI